MARRLVTFGDVTKVAVAGLLVLAAVLVPTAAHAATSVTSGTVSAGTTSSFWTKTFRLTSPGPVAVTLTWSDASADLNLFVKDPSGASAGMSTSKVGTQEQVSFEADATGTYRASVKAVKGSASFSLRIDYPGVSVPVYTGTIGGPGHAEISPSGLDVDPAGNTYVADTGNDQVAAYGPDGAQLWRTGFRGPNYKALGRFNNPRDVAFLGGRVYVADLANNRVQVLDAATGAPQSAWAFRFSSIIGISAGVDAQGRPVILTSDDQAQAVRVFQPDGTNPVVIGRGGTCPTAPCAPDLYNGPRDAATDAGGNVYVADYANDRMQKWSPSGQFLLAWGTKGSGPGQFGRPYGVDVSDSGDVYVADSNNGRVQRFTGSGQHVATYGALGGSAPDLSSGLRRVAVGAGPAPTVSAADLWGYRIQVFGNGGAPLRTLGNVPPPNGRFNEPYGVAVDGSATFVMDTNNQRVQRFDTQDAFVLKWGERGFGESNAGFNWARDITISPATGTVWVTDTKNNRLMEFGRDGTATGRSMGRLGKGPGRMFWPHAAAAHGTGLVVADTYNHGVALWDPATGTQVWTTTGTPTGAFRFPKDVEVVGGTVYVADSVNGRIVKLRASDGAFIEEFGSAALHRVEGVAVAPDGTIWTADTSWNRLVQLSATGQVLQVFGRASGVTAQPAHGRFNNPTHLEVRETGTTVELLVVDSWNDRIEVFDISG